MLPLTPTTIVEVVAALRSQEIPRQTDMLTRVADGQSPRVATTDDPVYDLDLDGPQAPIPARRGRRLRRQRQVTSPAELETQVVGEGEMLSWRVRVLRARGPEAPAVEFTEETMLRLLERAEEDRAKSQSAGTYWCYAQKALLAKKPTHVLLAGADVAGDEDASRGAHPGRQGSCA